MTLLFWKDSVFARSLYNKAPVEVSINQLITFSFFFHPTPSADHKKGGDLINIFSFCPPPSPTDQLIYGQPHPPYHNGAHNNIASLGNTDMYLLYTANPRSSFY